MWLLASFSEGPAGDPGNLRLRTLVPYATTVEAAAGVTATWVDNLPWPPPDNYAMKIPSQLDSCDGLPGTEFWDPAIVVLGVQWRGTAGQLVTRISLLFGRLGFTRTGKVPDWDTVGVAFNGMVWTKTDRAIGPIVLTLMPPGSTDPSHPSMSYQWIADLEANSTKPSLKSCV